jgi:hypothetical protein
MSELHFEKEKDNFIGVFIKTALRTEYSLNIRRKKMSRGEAFVDMRKTFYENL